MDFTSDDGPGANPAFLRTGPGPHFEYENPYVSVFRSGDTSIIAQRVKEVVPIASTVLGWEVKDIEKVVALLRDRGVAFEKYPHMDKF